MGWGSFTSSIKKGFKQAVSATKEVFEAPTKLAIDSAKAVGGAILGGEGGGSDNAQTANVSSDIDINLDQEKTASALEKTTLATLFVKTKLAEKELSSKEKDQQLKEDSLKISSLALQEQMRNNKAVLILSSIGVLLTFLGFIYTKYKGKK